MRRPPANPCPACGRARYKFASGDIAVLCRTDWLAVPAEVRDAYNRAGIAFMRDRRGQLDNMRAARVALIAAAKALRPQPSLALGGSV